MLPPPECLPQGYCCPEAAAARLQQLGWRGRCVAERRGRHKKERQAQAARERRQRKKEEQRAKMAAQLAEMMPRVVRETKRYLMLHAVTRLGAVLAADSTSSGAEDSAPP